MERPAQVCTIQGCDNPCLKDMCDECSRMIYQEFKCPSYPNATTLDHIIEGGRINDYTLKITSYEHHWNYHDDLIRDYRFELVKKRP
uniref:Uncharacterized protein n=1 Tax=Clandestinovirus TaxID=2831644 RepID=A0A8F8PK18_9VIRU|nr:hypothetical protein KOM_12_279 [Clandestinovirus]